MYQGNLEVSSCLDFLNPLQAVIDLRDIFESGITQKDLV